MYPTSAWYLQLARTSKFYLDQYVQLFLKWLRGRIKSPANIINALTKVYLMDATLQACQELFNAPVLSLMSNWHLQLARLSTLQPEKQVEPFLKWLCGRSEAPAKRINLPTSVDLSDTTLLVCQELLKAPFLLPTSAWFLN